MCIIQRDKWFSNWCPDEYFDSTLKPERTSHVYIAIFKPHHSNWNQRYLIKLIGLWHRLKDHPIFSQINSHHSSWRLPSRNNEHSWRLWHCVKSSQHAIRNTPSFRRSLWGLCHGSANCAEMGPTFPKWRRQHRRRDSLRPTAICLCWGVSANQERDLMASDRQKFLKPWICVRLRQALRRKRPNLLNLLILHDNAACHRAALT